MSLYVVQCPFFALILQLLSLKVAETFNDNNCYFELKLSFCATKKEDWQKNISDSSVRSTDDYKYVLVYINASK